MKSRRKNRKICFAASSGGHFEQLMMLRPLMNKYDSFIFTEKTSYEVKNADYKMYYVKQINRKERGYLFSIAVNFIKSLVIFIKERPDVVISTGAMATIPMCLIAKIAKRKLIYIESFAKVSSPTETGRFIYKYADRFYVQWEQMLDFYPDAMFLGGIY